MAGGTVRLNGATVNTARLHSVYFTAPYLTISGKWFGNGGGSDATGFKDPTCRILRTVAAFGQHFGEVRLIEANGTAPIIKLPRHVHG